MKSQYFYRGINYEIELQHLGEGQWAWSAEIPFNGTTNGLHGLETKEAFAHSAAKIDAEAWIDEKMPK